MQKNRIAFWEALGEFTYIVLQSVIVHRNDICFFQVETRHALSLPTMLNFYPFKNQPDHYWYKKQIESGAGDNRPHSAGAEKCGI